MMNLLNLKPILVTIGQFTDGSPVWHKLAESLVSGAFTFAGIVIAAYFAYRFALKQKRMETFIGLERIKYERKPTALENYWKLLEF